MKSVLVTRLEETIQQIGKFDFGDIIANYLLFASSIPRQIKREIKRARSFSCPKGYEKGLELLENAVRRGDDLSPWMSKSYKENESNNIDYLRFLFNILHFHIGNSFEHNRQRKITRSDKLLFAYIHDYTFYELAIEHHPKGSSWTDLKWLNIMDDNWPELLRPYILPNIVDLTYSPQTAEELWKLTEAGISTFIKIGDKVIYPMGGGVTSYRISDNNKKKDLRRLPVQYVIESNIIKNKLTKIEDTLTKAFGKEKLKDFHFKITNSHFIMFDSEQLVICIPIPKFYN